MKTCPQCRVVYEDEFLFCLSDGNTLVDESGEQETLVGNRVVFSEIDPGEMTEVMSTCGACGFSNRTNSKYCKKCGGALGVGTLPSAGQPFGFAAAGTPPFQPHTPQYDETHAFQSPVFMPPVSGAHARPSGGTNYTPMVIAAVLLAAIIIAGAVIYSSSGGEKPANKTANTNRSSPANNTARKESNSNTPKSSAESSLIGRTGRLNTNAHIRVGSTKYDEDRGTHYRGARIEVIDATTYDPGDGVVTWLKVKVLENGCDTITNQGCGNNWERNGSLGWMQADMEGWMNARMISLD